jgi:nicotinate-nucleotide pyrophosphorylase (carboxylating)
MQISDYSTILFDLSSDVYKITVMKDKRNDYNFIKLALKEDIGRGDITSLALKLGDKKGQAVVVAKSDGVISGLDQFKSVFKILDQKIKFKSHKKSSDRVKAKNEIIEIRGSMGDLLTGERTAMNIISHLSGVATLTSKFVEIVKNYPAKVLDTRKTMPGMRAWEKQAVKDGGGDNHRIGLYDMYLIKENHIEAAGGINEAIEYCRLHSKKTKAKIEVEVKNISELRTALRSKPDFILLDNFKIATLRKAVEITKETGYGTILEASGNVNLKSIKRIAATGVHRISIGQLTHSAPVLDLSFRIL